MVSLSLCFEPSQRHRVISGLWFHSVSLCFEPSQRHRVISGLWLHWRNSCCLHPWGKFGLAVVIVFVCWYVWWFVCVVICVCGVCVCYWCWMCFVFVAGEPSRGAELCPWSALRCLFLHTPGLHPGTTPCQTHTLPGKHTSCTPSLSDLYTAR